MKIAIVGASGLVGRKIYELLKNKNHELFLYSSKRSAGTFIDNHKLIELKEETIEKVDVALFSAGGTISKLWAEKFTKLGTFVIDNSNAYRRENFVPLVVPEINKNTINSHTKIIANPNCSTIQIALPLYYLNNVCKIKKVIVSTYQSASGAGQKGLLDLENSTHEKFPHVLKDNLIPHIDIPLPDGYTLEEDKIRFELRKILNTPNLQVTATAVRVPIRFCHGASIYVEFESEFNVKNVEFILKNADGIIVKNDLSNQEYPLPLQAHETDFVYVGRIRQDLDNNNAITFWSVADNLRKGAASNAVQILNHLEKSIF